MLPDISKLTKRWLYDARLAWPLLVATTIVAATLGYRLASRSQQPLPPPFAFTSSTSTIEASGTWHTSGSSLPNATKIFCWFPVNSCQVTVAELVPDGAQTRFQLLDTDFDIMQLSDASLTTNHACIMVRVSKTHRIQGCGAIRSRPTASSPRNRHPDHNERAAVLGAVKVWPGNVGAW
jgi:hypothetical protein